MRRYKRGAKHRPSRGIIDDEAADRYDSFLENLSKAAAVTEGEILYGVDVVVQPEQWDLVLPSSVLWKIL